MKVKDDFSTFYNCFKLFCIFIVVYITERQLNLYLNILEFLMNRRCVKVSVGLLVDPVMVFTFVYILETYIILSKSIEETWLSGNKDEELVIYGNLIRIGLMDFPSIH